MHRAIGWAASRANRDILIVQKFDALQDFAVLEIPVKRSLFSFQGSHERGKPCMPKAEDAVKKAMQESVLKSQAGGRL